MEVILEHEADLKIQWHPGCVFGGNDNQPQVLTRITKPLNLQRYTVSVIGMTGSTGCSCTPEERPKEPQPIKRKVPSSLEVWIEAKSPDYGLIVEGLVTLQQAGDSIDIIVDPPTTQTIYGGILPKKAAEAQKIKDANAKIMARYREIVRELKSMGICKYDVPQPKLPAIPIQFYVQTKRELSGRIEVRCHKNTKFYQFFQEHGLFEKYFPQWYRDGRY